MTDDERIMSRALELAEQGRGWVEPNPLVGAVVVLDGRVVGEGWHQQFGGPHAEVHALASAGESARGATLYVTLEPCCHQGKTPPCTESILRAGIVRVVTAMTDPFPQVSGQGIARLREAGLLVAVGCGEQRARRLNAPYLKLLTTGRPYIHAKWAMTLDGKIATRTGDSRWISNESSRRVVHDLRGKMDAILVGIGTVLADDPLLTARPLGPRNATRIVLDTNLRLPLECQLVRTARAAPVLVATASGERADAYQCLGCEVLVCRSERGQIVLADLLEELGRRRMTNLLVEGGARVFGSFLDAREIDEVHAFVAPKLAGGERGLSPLSGLGVDRIGEAIALSRIEAKTLDGDVYLHAWREHVK